tara:strand:- start:452 stop:859 length:408 start_codon:yes stop_codon:yes gene_type:complete
MTNYALNSVKESYDIDTLREIVEHGCSSGVAHDHIYYSETLSFFDNYEDEIIEYITNNYGDEIIEQLWNDNPCNITGYKNDTVWCFVELVASQLVDEYEDTTCQELSELDEDVYPNLTELSNTEWGKSHLEIVTA